jgi:hypothetical protein
VYIAVSRKRSKASYSKQKPVLFQKRKTIEIIKNSKAKKGNINEPLSQVL